MLRRTLALSALLLPTFPALTARADVRVDSFSSTTRDTALWNETESWRNTAALRDKVSILQDGSVLSINGLGGKGGGAAYLSTYRIDWNDGFRVRFRTQFDAFIASLPGQSAVVGVSFGFDRKFSLATGHSNAVVVEFERTPLGQTAQLVLRRGAVVLGMSPKVAVGDGEHAFEFEFLTNAPDNTVAMNLYVDGASEPLASVPSFAAPTGLDAKPLTAALYGLARGTPRFGATFDDFELEGDIYDDTNDASWEDFDSHGDGPSGERTESADLYSVRYGYYTVSAQFPQAFDMIISGEVRDGAVVFVFRETATTVRVAKTSVVDLSLIDSFVRPARADERAAIASVWNGASISGADAVPFVLQTEPGTYFRRGALDLKTLPARWSVRTVGAENSMADFTVPADGITSGDGLAGVAPIRFNHALGTAYDTYAAGQGRIVSARMASGILEVAFSVPSAPGTVKVVRINWRTKRSAGVISRAATAAESYACDIVSTGQWNYWMPNIAWEASMANDGAPVVKCEIIDDGTGQPVWHTVLRLPSGELVDDYRNTL